jgi:nucleoside-diphosphate-sugar epimerase
VTILRPPVVYGPGDRESFRLFQAGRHRYVPVPGPMDARNALIHVRDLVRLIAALAAGGPADRVLTAADANPQGYRRDELLAAAARAVGNTSARLVPAPGLLLRAVAWTGDLARLFGAASMLNSQKLRELRHPDWSVTPGARARSRLDARVRHALGFCRRACLVPARGLASRLNADQRSRSCRRSFQ